MTEKILTIEEKKTQLDKVRRAFRNPDLRGWIPRYLLTILEEGDAIEDTLSKMEQVMPKYCEPRKFATEELRSLDEGSEKQNDWRSLLVELSPAVRAFWAERYRNYINPNGRYQTLLGFADMREKYMGISHGSSVQLLYEMGWKPMDAMCAYLLGMTTNRMYSLSPDAVKEAVRLDREAAVRLLDKKALGEAIVHHHFSYQTEWQKLWMEFLYLFCGFEDQAFLHMKHKTKKLKQQCLAICEKLAGPDYERLELEKNLRACALLPPKEEMTSISDKKFEKKQKAALLNAFVCHYQWSCSDWEEIRYLKANCGISGIGDSSQMEMQACPSGSLPVEIKNQQAGQTMIENLLWGYYENGELQKAFALKENGQITDENEEAVSGAVSSGQGRIGLVHPEELTEAERDIWKKHARKEKWKQPFPQLKMPVYQGKYDLAAFSGMQVTQLFMITAAGKWGLYQGSGKNQYMSYHMADLLHGYGAQLTFDGIWRGAEYGPEIITMDKVVFYRFQHFLLWDHVPESLRCAPEELPARFVSTAMAAFQGISGKGIRKE